jgi:hypothetical protein
VLLVTTFVVMVNCALEVPAGTAILVGTVAQDVLLLVSETVIPPVGAWPLSVTVPVVVVPPTTDVGEIDKETDIGLSVSCCDTLAPP